MRIAIVVSRYNPEITESLLEGARAEFERCGGSGEDLLVVRAPGAFELPVLAQASTAGQDAVVALGCVIQGETRHDEVIADAIANGLIRVALDSGVPTLFGVLTTGTFEQAKARAQAPRSGRSSAAGSGKLSVDNKGVEAMAAAIDAVLELRRVQSVRAAGAIS